MSKKEIILDAPNVGALEKEYLNMAIDSGYVSTVGPYIKDFEQKCMEFLNVSGAVAVQSGTEAIHIVLHELGVGLEDEVIVPALTFIATVNPILYVGAKPVFVDVDPHSWTIDVDQVRNKITKKTKAIIPVHLYGNPCHMKELMDIAEEENIHVLEDATESLGSEYKGNKTGTVGNMGVLSFNGNKTITTGGGGMVVSNDVKRIDHIRFLINQGRDASKGYFHPEVGFNYRMTNIEAALGLAQLVRLEEFLLKKQEFYNIYRSELNNVDEIEIQKEVTGTKSSRWLTAVTFSEDVDIDELQRYLLNKGIQTRRVFKPVPEFPPYESFKDGEYKNASFIHERGLCLPGSTLNEEKDISFVCEQIKNAIKGKNV